MTDVAVSFRIYVAGQAPNSRRAQANLTAFCRQFLADRHAIEVVDVLAEPDRALAEKVLLTPTLAILAPLPVRMIVGDLSDAAVLRQALGPELDEPGAPADGLH